MICLLFKICFVALSGPNIQKYKVDSQNIKDYHVGNGQNLYKLYKTYFAAQHLMQQCRMCHRIDLQSKKEYSLHF